MPFVIVGIAAVLAIAGVYFAQQQASAAADSPVYDDAGNVLGYETAPSVPYTDESGGVQVAQIDPGNRSTWPAGDAIWKFCQAVAQAEGYGPPNNVPTTHCNPGDLGPGDTGYPGDVHSGSTVSYMPDHTTGWQALYAKWSRIFQGKSSTYPNTMTIVQAAQKYAGDWANWSRNVSSNLGVSESTRLIDWYRGQQ